MAADSLSLCRRVPAIHLLFDTDCSVKVPGFLILALVDLEIDGVGLGRLVVELLALHVVLDHDRGGGPDVDDVALVANISLVVSIGDSRQDRGFVELNLATYKWSDCRLCDVPVTQIAGFAEPGF